MVVKIAHKTEKVTQYAHDWDGAIALIRWLATSRGNKKVESVRSAKKWLGDLPDFDYMIEYCPHCDGEVTDYTAELEWLMESIKDAMFLERNLKYMTAEVTRVREELKKVFDRELKCRKISTNSKGNGKKKPRINL